MGTDSPPQASTATFSAVAVTFSPVEPRRDGILVLRRDSESPRSSPRSHTATPANNSPQQNSNLRFAPDGTPGTHQTAPPLLTPVPNSESLLQPVDEEPYTPSSTVVEFGDLAKGNVPSAVELVENIRRTYSQSPIRRSESRASTKAGGEGREGRETRDQSRNRGCPPWPRRERRRCSRGAGRPVPLGRRSAREMQLARRAWQMSA
ncbi:hypothetical protein VTK56DRAFT_4302 [Thermocarpiscus australiensis]